MLIIYSVQFIINYGWLEIVVLRWNWVNVLWISLSLPWNLQINKKKPEKPNRFRYWFSLCDNKSWQNCHCLVAVAFGGW